LLIKYFVLQTVINLGVSIGLVFSMGMVGVALGTLVASIVVTILVMLRASVIYHLPIRQWFLEGVAPILIPSIGQCAMCLFLLRFWPPQSLLAVMVENIPGVVLFGALFWGFATTAQEKTLFLAVFKRSNRQ
jgi:hypothetical protein